MAWGDFAETGVCRGALKSSKALQELADICLDLIPIPSNKVHIHSSILKNKAYTKHDKSSRSQCRPILVVNHTIEEWRISHKCQNGTNSAQAFLHNMAN